MPPKRKKQAVIPPTPKDPSLKKNFFTPRSTTHASAQREEEKPPTLQQQKKPHQLFTRPRRFVYDEDTGEPYAEWIDGEAICLETGEVLFQSRTRIDRDDELSSAFQQQRVDKFDFAVPTDGSRHPLDPAICSQYIIDTGVISIDHFRTGDAGISLQIYNELIANRHRGAI